MIPFKHLAILAFALCLSASCIREDRSDCKGDVFIQLQYFGDGDTDIFQEKIGKVNMYVYSLDGSRLYSEHCFEGGSDEVTGQKVHLMLTPGNYRIVCWGNMNENTAADTGWGTAHVAEPAHFQGSDEFSGTDSLYFASTDISVPETLVDAEGVCDFQGSHINMSIRLKGFAGAIPAGTKSSGSAGIAVTHCGAPEYTDFTNTPSDDRCDISPEFIPDPDDEDSFVAQYNVFRFDEDDQQSRIVLSDTGTGESIHEISLRDFVSRYGIRITGRHEVTIPILITLTGTGVTVIDWDIEEVDPGFDKN